MAVLIRVNGGVAGDEELVGARYNFGRFEDIDSIELFDADGKLLNIIPLEQIKFINTSHDIPANKIPVKEKEGITAVRIDGGVKGDVILKASRVIIERPKFKQVIVLLDKDEKPLYLTPINNIRYVDFNYKSKKQATNVKSSK